MFVRLEFVVVSYILLREKKMRTKKYIQFNVQSTVMTVLKIPNCFDPCHRWRSCQTAEIKLNYYLQGNEKDTQTH